jgi:hypothetical protein
MILVAGSDKEVRPEQELRGATPEGGNLGCSAFAGDIASGAVNAATRMETCKRPVVVIGLPPLASRRSRRG